MDTMTIEELKALLDKATRGPWKWVRDHSGLGGPWRLTPGVMWPSNSEATPGGDEIDRANASLIVLAPTLDAGSYERESAILDDIARAITANVEPLVDRYAALRKVREKTDERL